MTTSINQPWAVTDKFRQRYGAVWADMDFVFHAKISEDAFRTDPLNTSMGELQIAGQRIPMRYKDLLSYTKSLDTLSTNLYSERVGKTETFEVSVKGRDFQLNRIEIGKLSQTVSDASASAMKAYEVGLFL